jgi:hypothetical protein
MLGTVIVTLIYHRHKLIDLIYVNHSCIDCITTHYFVPLSHTALVSPQQNFLFLHIHISR